MQLTSEQCHLRNVNREYGGDIIPALKVRPHQRQDLD